MEPFFLQRVSELIFQLSPDLSPHVACEFQRIFTYAEACDPAFVVCEVHSAQLVYYHHPAQPFLKLLVIPPGGGLRYLLLQEMHCALGGHLGIRKISSSLLHHGCRVVAGLVA